MLDMMLPRGMLYEYSYGTRRSYCTHAPLVSTVPYRTTDDWRKPDTVQYRTVLEALADWQQQVSKGGRGVMSTRLGGCTGDLRSCANVRVLVRVPSMGGQILFLNVVLHLALFGHQQFGNMGKIPDGPCFMVMGAAGQKCQFPPVAYKGSRTSAWP